MTTRKARTTSRTLILAMLVGGVWLGPSPLAKAQEGATGPRSNPNSTMPSQTPPSGAPESYLPHQFLPPTATIQSGIAATDAYGNAQFDLPERRELGIFQTTAEWEALGAYQMLNRQDKRGGSTYFALPGDLLGLSTMGTLANAASPSILADVSPAKRRALMQYGGFGERQNPAMEDDISAAFARRQRLIAANSAYAPVYRAIMENSSFAGLRPLVSSTPFMPSENPTQPEVAASGPSLSDLLDTDTQTRRRGSLRDAWQFFEDGEYRRAARIFESALTLDSSDPEARVGEIFCYAAVGSVETAALLVMRFNAIAENPFQPAIDVRGRFANEELVQSLLRDGRFGVDSISASQSPNVTATYVVILWYLGDKEAAARGARGLARGTVTAYKDWPAKMEAAAALPVSTSR